MERTIITDAVATDVILLSTVEELFSNEGIIIVYRKDKIVGSVIYNEGTYFLGLNEFTSDYSSLAGIIKDNPLLTFKYIT